ncbi:MAG: hypothetical protein RLZZ522_559 [Verrucomicrobiota bacterium]
MKRMAATAMGRSGGGIIGCLGWEFWWQGVLSALAQGLEQQTPQRDRLQGIFTVAIAHSSTHLPKPWRSSVPPPPQPPGTPPSSPPQAGIFSGGVGFLPRPAGCRSPRSSLLPGLLRSPSRRPHFQTRSGCSRSCLSARRGAVSPAGGLAPGLRKRRRGRCG